MGWIKDATGSFSGGLLFIAGCGLAAMIIVLLLPHEEHVAASAELADARSQAPRDPGT